ncbi:hypothetical protein O181_050163 [Austropuccinia psidii MF-1]|uniref:Alpha-galactosidase n=1 Tax=Austropuccinia psidii MF-1 TaxID=1389203 RepID=A0A9Q3E188_9BASI|nr:hypothetical protein [Austropuccinia psidii MF-1]
MSGDIYDNFDRPEDRCPCQDSTTPCSFAGFHCSGLFEGCLNHWDTTDLIFIKVMNILKKAAGSRGFDRTCSKLEMVVSHAMNVSESSICLARSFFPIILVANESNFLEVTHFSMWALTKSPLILGNDIVTM